MSTDPKRIIRSVVEGDIVPENLTRDDGVTQLKTAVTLDYPPHILLRDWIVAQNYDYVFTVSRIRDDHKRRVQEVPKLYDGLYGLHAWAIQKYDDEAIDDTWRYKMITEIRRIFDNNNSDTNPYCQYYIGDVSDEDVKVNGTILYKTTFTIVYKQYET